MKKLTLISAILAIFAVSAFTFAGDDTPAAVKVSFAKLYPDITKVKWGKEDAYYEAEFKMNTTAMSCLFDSKGKLLETETEIAITDLPKSVSDYVTKNYAGKKIKGASKIVNFRNVLTYEAEVTEVGDVIFDSKGNFLRVSKD